MNPKGKKFISLFLVISLLALTGNLMAREMRGAKLIIQKEDGSQIEGELIAVKQNTLLLLDLEIGAGVPVDIKDIKVIKINKKSKFLLGIFSGLLVVLIYPSGGITAGIWGVIEGFDIVVDLKGRSEEEMRRILRKLNEKSLFPQKLPENVENVAPDVHLQKLKSAGITKRSYAKPRRFRRLHLTYELGYFFSRGADGLNEIIESWGFGYPRHHFSPNFLLKDIKLEYSVNQKFVLGFTYTFLGKFRARGYDEMRQFDTTQSIELFSEFQGSAYILTTSYWPIADGFLKDSTFKISLGFGLSVVDLTFQTGYGEFSPSKEFSIKSPCILLSAEYDHYFNQNWSIGINIGYKYAPLKIEAFSFSLTGLYFDINKYVPFTFTRYFPEKKFNIGGLGIGLNFSFHF